MLGPFATASRFTLPFTRCRYCRTPPAHRCPRRRRRQQRQRVTGDSYGPIEWAQLYRVAQKIATVFSTPQLYQLLMDFLNCFTVRIRGKFAMIPSLKIPPHFKHVDTLPCEISLSGANCHSISLITSLFSGVTGLKASSSSKGDTSNI